MHAEVRIVADKFPVLAGSLPGAASTVVRKVTLDAEAGAKGLIVQFGLIDTGALLNSMRARFLDPLHGIVGPAVFYGIFHEYGTARGLPARPFVGPTVEGLRAPFEAAMRAALRVWAR